MRIPACKNLQVVIDHILPKTAWAVSKKKCIKFKLNALPENLAWLAASKFTLDVAIQFKLGRAPPSELLTNSNLVAKHVSLCDSKNKVLLATRGAKI
jgi:hypothetical protein